MIGDAHEDGLSSVEPAKRAAPVRRGNSARLAARSMAGSTLISRLVCRRRKLSGGSSSYSTPRRQAMPARSIRWRRACCRSLSARRPRQCLSFRTEPNPPLSRAMGRRERDRRRRGGNRRALGSQALSGRNRKPPAALRRRDPADAANLLRDPHSRLARLRPRARRRDFRDRAAPDQCLPARTDICRG